MKGLRVIHRTMIWFNETAYKLFAFFPSRPTQLETSLVRKKEAIVNENGT